MAFEQKEGLVFRDSGFSLVSALPVQRVLKPIKKLVSLAAVFLCFA